MRGRTAFLVIAIGATCARAERLPVRSYGAAEGLQGDNVRAIAQDARGFLWFATNAGVARYDGHEFVEFGAREGIPGPSALRIVAAPDGTVYALTRGGVVRTPPASPSAGPPFETVLAGRPFDDGAADIAVAPDGRLAVADARGVALLPRDPARDEPERIDLGEAPGPPGAPRRDAVWAIAFDRGGALWAVRTYGLARRTRDGVATVWPFPEGRVVVPEWGWWPSLRCDAAGRLWIVTPGNGVWGIRPDARAGAPVLGPILDEASGLPSRLTRDVWGASDGSLWIATTAAGLVRAEPSGAGFRFARYGTANGLPDDEVDALAVDDAGNVWCGTRTGGAARIAAGGWTTWGTAEGLATPEAVAIVDEGPDGLLVETSRLHLARIRGGRVTSWRVRPATPGAENLWGGRGTILRDRRGRTWLATAAGVYVYAAGMRAEEFATHRPARVLTSRDGLGGDQVFQLYEDRRGAVWVGLVNAKGEGLCSVDPATFAVRCFGAAGGLPPGAGAAFAEDDAGDLWVGLYEGGTFRYRDGRFATWPEIAPARSSGVSAIRRAADGALWIAGGSGVVRVLDPGSPEPRFARVATAQAPASIGAACTEEDREGRVYVATGRSVDRLDLRTGAVRSFTTADGLASNEVIALHRDSSGALWAATSRGVSRLMPRDDPSPGAPRVWITSVKAAGRLRDARGAALTLASGENNLEFAFTSPGFRAGERMRFATRLVGAGGAWGPPGDARVVSYPGLGPGRYRFEVRAIDADGATSPGPAAVAFTIRPPFWRSRPFLAAAALLLLGAAVALYRYRVARLLTMERIRTRIATDLHDDIGASLSQIAVLSQVARRRAARDGAGASGTLGRITELSGELVDAMGDVVWAINPARDNVGDLATRMRRFATELVAESRADLDLVLPAASDGDRLDPEVRRQTFLVFKEALHNAVRHGRPRRIEVALSTEDGGLLLRVADDGAGIADPGASHGHGLASMRARAEAIGASLEIRSTAGAGTVVTFRVGRHPRRFLSRKIGAPRRAAR